MNMRQIPQATPFRPLRRAPAFLLGTSLLLCAVFCAVAPLYADQSQSFVFLADTQGGTADNQVNTAVLNPIMDTILHLNPLPKVVLFGGDATTTGGTANLQTFQNLFTDRLNAAGIPSAYAIGNHEPFIAPGLDTPLVGQQQFQALFNNNWVQNGPAGFANLAFSFHIGNSLFIVADSFYATTNVGNPPYGINAAQQAWMAGLLQNNTAAHTFVLTHVPAWAPTTPSADPQNPDTWTTITTSGSATNTNASILFTGHEHLYYRTLHDGTYEVISGSAGAPLKCENPNGCFPVYPGDVFAMQYNYTVVTIDGRYVTVNVFDPNNQTLDAFHFFDNSGVNNATINNAVAIAPDAAEQQPAGILAGSHNIITNSAAMSNVFTGVDAISNNVITNSGSIAPLPGGNGIHVYDNNNVTNSLTGSITGNSAGLWGIWVNSGNSVINNGTIAVAGTGSVAFFAQGDNNRFTNTGALSASGTASYAAKFMGTGNTFVNSGTISGNIWFDAGNNTFTNNGTFDGSGGLYKVNSGTLTLRGVTSYAGSTYLNGGAINVTQDASLGALSGGLVFDGGTLQLSADVTSARSVTVNPGGGIFDTGGNVLTLTGVLSGTGNLVKAGTGNLILSGNGSGYTGQGSVSDGLLFLSAGATLGGTLTVNPAGVVGGYGTLGSVTNNGTLSPGGAVGTLNINGNYNQGAAGKLIIEVASPAGSDLLSVNGTANLKGVLQTSWSGGYIPAPGTTFGTILTAAAGVQGQFSSLLTNITPTVVFKPKYDTANQVYLVVERDYSNENLLPFLTANQAAVGSMLNSVRNTATGDLSSVLAVIDALPTYGQTAGALDQLAPRGSEATAGMGISGASFQTGNLSERLSDLRHGIGGASLRGLYFKNWNGPPIMLADINPNPVNMLPSRGNERWGFFARGNAAYGDQKDRPDSTGYDFTGMGIIVGADYRFTGNFIAGLMVGLNNSRANVDNSGSKVKMDSYSLGAYGTYYKKNFYVDGSMSYGFANYDDTRRIVFPGLDRTASASPNGNQLTLYGGTGYDIRRNSWIITPNISFQYTKLGIDSYTESGAGALNLDVDKQNTESLLGNTGVRASYIWKTDKILLVPGIRASWGHEFSRDSQNVSSRLVQGSSPFSIQTASPDRNFLSLGTGITVFTVRGMSVYLNYDAQIGENKYVAHNMNAGVRIGF